MELVRLAAVANAGHRFWLFPIVVPIVWLGFHYALEEFEFMNPIVMADAQTRMMGLPLAIIGIFLGLRIIAGEINARSIEIVYTVPGGAEKVWWIKFFAAILILIPTEILLALGTWFVFTEFAFEALYGALQSGVFFIVIAMGFSTLFRSEVGGAIASVALLAFFGLASNFGGNQARWSPFFNPYAIPNEDFSTLLAWTIQNRIAMFLLMIGILSLAFMRGNRRERLLGA